LCGHYRALINWQDMGYPYEREHIFMAAGRDRVLFNALLKNGDSVILTDKMNGWGKYFETMSLVLGMWASGIVAHWGFNAEDWWWFEQGYGKRFLPSKGRRGYARQHGKGFAVTKGRDFASAVSCPDIFYAQNLLWAIAGGATVYSFEMPSHAFASPDRKGVYRLTPAWKNAIYPLLKATLEGNLIPDREQAVAKMKVAYQDSGEQGTELDTPGEQLYRPLYGTCESDAKILSQDLSSALIPRSGRYYFLPVIPKLAPRRARARFPHIIRPHQFADGHAERAYFDKIYPAESSGQALALHINHVWFVTNWHENQNIAQDFSFRLAITGRPVELSGRLLPHSMILVTERPNYVSLLVNNYLVNTHIWDEPLPETFDAQHYLEDYVTSPDDNERRITTLQLVVLGEGTPVLSHETRHGSVQSKWDPASGKMQVVLEHNGPVDLTFSLY
jgi:Glycosyl hydrolase family 98 C-terminal domain